MGTGKILSVRNSVVDPYTFQILMNWMSTFGITQPISPSFRANKWESLSPLPQKKGDLVCRFFNERLVVVGGMGAESMEVLPQVRWWRSFLPGIIAVFCWLGYCDWTVNFHSSGFCRMPRLRSRLRFVVSSWKVGSAQIFDGRHALSSYELKSRVRQKTKIICLWGTRTRWTLKRRRYRLFLNFRSAFFTSLNCCNTLLVLL